MQALRPAGWLMLPHTVLLAFAAAQTLALLGRNPNPSPSPGPTQATPPGPSPSADLIGQPAAALLPALPLQATAQSPRGSPPGGNGAAVTPSLPSSRVAAQTGNGAAGAVLGNGSSGAIPYGVTGAVPYGVTGAGGHGAQGSTSAAGRGRGVAGVSSADRAVHLGDGNEDVTLLGQHVGATRVASAGNGKVVCSGNSGLSAGAVTGSRRGRGSRGGLLAAAFAPNRARIGRRGFSVRGANAGMRAKVVL